MEETVKGRDKQVKTMETVETVETVKTVETEETETRVETATVERVVDCPVDRVGTLQGGDARGDARRDTGGDAGGDAGGSARRDAGGNAGGGAGGDARRDVGEDAENGGDAWMFTAHPHKTLRGRRLEEVQRTPRHTTWPPQ